MDRSPNIEKWIEIIKEYRLGDDMTLLGIKIKRNATIKLNALWQVMDKKERRWAVLSSAFFDETYEDIEKCIAKDFYAIVWPSEEQLEIFEKQVAEYEKAKPKKIIVPEIILFIVGCITLCFILEALIKNP